MEVLTQLNNEHIKHNPSPLATIVLILLQVTMKTEALQLSPQIDFYPSSYLHSSPALFHTPLFSKQRLLAGFLVGFLKKHFLLTAFEAHFV